MYPTRYNGHYHTVCICIYIVYILYTYIIKENEGKSNKKEEKTSSRRVVISLI